MSMFCCMRSNLQYRSHSSLPHLQRHLGFSDEAMAEVRAHSPLTLRPVHPPKVEKRAIKPSIARHVNIRVNDPLDHDAPAILHEPRSYNFNESKGSAVVLVSGAGGGVSGPGSILSLPTLFDPSICGRSAINCSVLCN